MGYALGGLDWTDTLLGTAFQSQEQILFFFAAILFSVSVILHLLSIEEEQYLPQNDRIEQVRHCRFETLGCFFFVCCFFFLLAIYQSRDSLIRTVQVAPTHHHPPMDEPGSLRLSWN